VRRYAHLLRLSIDLASTLDLDILLHRIVEAARELTESEAASLLLHDPNSGNLYFQAATDLLIEGLGTTAIPTDSSIAGWIFRHGEPLLVEDALQDERFFREVDVITRFKTKSILGVPLIAKGKTLGVIEAVNKKAGEYEQEDTQLLQSLAAQAAIAIENIRLFQQNDLVAEMVHELRTPLTALTAAANLLQRPDLPEGQRRKIAATVHEEVQRLNGMATGFLELARLETGRSRFYREPVHLGGLVEECLEIVRPQAEEEQVSLEVERDPRLSPVMGDRNRLKQVFLNLLSNGIKYNHPEGRVLVRLFQEGEEVRVEFEDTGRGIPSDSIDHIFDRFYRVQEQDETAGGTGLGLTIVKRIVEGHGGTIEVESELGSGSTFVLHLPVGSSLKRDTRPVR
jgi:signal transduction histidine kinase